MKQGDKKGKGMSLTEPYVLHCLQHPSSAQPSSGGHGAGEPPALAAATWHPKASPAPVQREGKGRALVLSKSQRGLRALQTSPWPEKPHLLATLSPSLDSLKEF